jgi:hypothetical protein
MLHPWRKDPAEAVARHELRLDELARAARFYLRDFDTEHTWRGRGEWAIRAEMERRLRRRLGAHA